MSRKPSVPEASALTKAVIQGDLEETKRLLEDESTQVDETDSEGLNALFYALMHERVECALEIMYYYGSTLSIRANHTHRSETIAQCLRTLLGALQLYSQHNNLRMASKGTMSASTSFDGTNDPQSQAGSSGAEPPKTRALAFHTLDLSGLPLENEHVYYIASIMRLRHMSITALDLSHSQIGDEGAILLANALSRTENTVRRVNLSANEITDVGGKKLAKLISSRIIHLDVSFNQLSANVRAQIQAAVGRNFLEYTLQDAKHAIICSGKMVGNDGVRRIIEFLTGQNAKETVQELGFSGIERKVFYLFQRLVLRDNGITLVKPFADFLLTPDGRGITVIDLAGNSLGDAGAAVLAHVLKENCPLAVLNLERNGIENAGTAALAAALESNTFLRVLSLRKNLLGNDAAKALATAFGAPAFVAGSKLSHLNLRYNLITDSGAKGLLQAAPVQQGRLVVYMDSNPVGKAVLQTARRHSMSNLNASRSDSGKSAAALTESKENLVVVVGDALRDALAQKLAEAIVTTKSKTSPSSRFESRFATAPAIEPNTPMFNSNVQSGKGFILNCTLRNQADLHRLHNAREAILTTAGFVPMVVLASISDIEIRMQLETLALSWNCPVFIHADAEGQYPETVVEAAHAICGRIDSWLLGDVDPDVAQLDALDERWQADIESEAQSLYREMFKSLQVIQNKARAPCIMVVGPAGSGKSSLINRVFQSSVALAGAGLSQTRGMEKYENSKVRMFDTVGVEKGEMKLNEFKQKLANECRAKFSLDSPEDTIHVVWYVLSGSRWEQFDKTYCDIITEVCGRPVPVLVLLNKSDQNPEEIDAMKKAVLSRPPEHLVGVFRTVSVSDSRPITIHTCPFPGCGSYGTSRTMPEYVFTCDAKGHKTSTAPLNELNLVLEKTQEIMPDSVRSSFVSSQKVHLQMKRNMAPSIIWRRLKTLNSANLFFGKKVTRVFVKILAELAHLYGFTRVSERELTDLSQVFDFRLGPLLFLQKKKIFVHMLALVVLWNYFLAERAELIVKELSNRSGGTGGGEDTSGILSQLRYALDLANKRYFLNMPWVRETLIPALEPVTGLNLTQMSEVLEIRRIFANCDKLIRDNLEQQKPPPAQAPDGPRESGKKTREILRQWMTKIVDERDEPAMNAFFFAYQTLCPTLDANVIVMRLLMERFPVGRFSAEDPRQSVQLRVIHVLIYWIKEFKDDFRDDDSSSDGGSNCGDDAESSMSASTLNNSLRGTADLKAGSDENEGITMRSLVDNFLESVEGAGFGELCRVIEAMLATRSDRPDMAITPATRPFLLQFSPESIANALTTKHFNIFCKIKMQSFVIGDKSNISEMNAEFNRVSNWVVSTIVSETNMENRIKLMVHFVEVLKGLDTLKNFHGMMAVLSAFNRTPVARLEVTWKGLQESRPSIYADLKDLVNPNSTRSSNIQKRLLETNPPCVPFLVGTLRMIEQEKARQQLADQRGPGKFAEIVETIRRFQKHPPRTYEVHEDLRDHLDQLKALESEEEMMRFSLQIEPRPKK